MNSTILFLLLLLAPLFRIKLSAQHATTPTPSYIIIEKLPIAKWSKREKGTELTDEEKHDKLKMLPKGERVEFEMDYDEETGETTYWEFSLSGLYFLDLDFDGDLDLLYSAQNGGMMQTATKVFYNNNNALELHSILRDGILDIKRNKDNFEVYTLFQPCCDSYTTRIDQYRFSSKDSAVFIESISLIGRSRIPYIGMLGFSTKKKGLIKNPSIYALPTDFRNLHGYFKERNKEVRDIIRSRKILELIKVEGEVEFGILSETTFKGELYYLVITEPLNDLPKMPISLYEWSDGDGRRLVGWVKVEELK